MKQSMSLLKILLVFASVVLATSAVAKPSFKYYLLLNPPLATNQNNADYERALSTTLRLASILTGVKTSVIKEKMEKVPSDDVSVKFMIAYGSVISKRSVDSIFKDSQDVQIWDSMHQGKAKSILAVTAAVTKRSIQDIQKELPPWLATEFDTVLVATSILTKKNETEVSNIFNSSHGGDRDDKTWMTTLSLLSEKPLEELNPLHKTDIYDFFYSDFSSAIPLIKAAFGKSVAVNLYTQALALMESGRRLNSSHNFSVQNDSHCVHPNGNIYYKNDQEYCGTVYYDGDDRGYEEPPTRLDQYGNRIKENFRRIFSR